MVKKQLMKLGESRFNPQLEGKCRLVRILVVDDNPAVRHYLRALLEQQSTWQVCDEARTGGEAIQRVKKNPPVMISLDSQMPDLNPLDVARQTPYVFPEITQLPLRVTWPPTL